MSIRTVSCAFIFLMFATVISQAQTAQQLKSCRLTSKPLTLQQSTRPMKLSGNLKKEGKHEYRLRVKSNLTVEVRLKTTSQLTLDVYLLKPQPPKKLKTMALDWYDTLFANNEYALVVSNCFGTTPGTYQIEITVPK